MDTNNCIYRLQAIGIERNELSLPLDEIDLLLTLLNEKLSTNAFRVRHNIEHNKEIAFITTMFHKKKRNEKEFLESLQHYAKLENIKHVHHTFINIHREFIDDHPKIEEITNTYEISLFEPDNIKHLFSGALDFTNNKFMKKERTFLRLKQMAKQMANTTSFTSFIEIAEECIQANYKISECYFILGSISQTNAFHYMKLSSGMHFREAHFLYAEMLLEQGKIREAIDVLYLDRENPLFDYCTAVYSTYLPSREARSYCMNFMKKSNNKKHLREIFLFLCTVLHDEVIKIDTHPNFAIEFMKEYMKKCNFPKALIYIGSIHEFYQETDKALECYDQALRTGVKAAYFMKMKLYMKRGLSTQANFVLQCGIKAGSVECKIYDILTKEKIKENFSFLRSHFETHENIFDFTNKKQAFLLECFVHEPELVRKFSNPTLRFIADHVNFGNQECFVCYEEKRQNVKFTCKHSMCVECFIQSNAKTCPYCRHPIFD